MNDKKLLDSHFQSFWHLPLKFRDLALTVTWYWSWTDAPRALLLSQDIHFEIWNLLCSDYKINQARWRKIRDFRLELIMARSMHSLIAIQVRAMSFSRRPIPSDRLQNLIYSNTTASGSILSLHQTDRADMFRGQCEAGVLTAIFSGSESHRGILRRAKSFYSATFGNPTNNTRFKGSKNSSNAVLTQ